MPENKKHYDDSLMQMITAAQSGVPFSYNPSTYFGQGYAAIEEQSRDLIKDFIEGIAEFENEKALELFEDLLIFYGQNKKDKRTRDLTKKAKEGLEKEKNRLSTAEAYRKKINNFERIHSILQSKKAKRTLSLGEMADIKKALQKNIAADARNRRSIEWLDSLALAKCNELAQGKIQTSASELKKFINAFNTQGQANHLYMQLEALEKHQKSAESTPEQVVSEATARKRLSSGWGTKLKAFAQKAQTAVKDSWKSIKSHFLRNKNKYRNGLLIGAFGLGAAGVTNIIKKNPEMLKNNTKNIPVNTIDTIQHSNNGSEANNRIAPFIIPEQENQAVQGPSALEQAYRRHYDNTALALCYGKTRDINKARELKASLENRLGNLIDNGTIKLNSISKEHLVYGYAIYEAMRPNSKENKILHNVLNGNTEKAEKVEDIIIKAGKRGENLQKLNQVEANKQNFRLSTYSSIDNAPQEIQQEYLHTASQIRFMER